MKRLKFLLEKSGAYATILGSKLAKQQEQAREKAAQIDQQEPAQHEKLRVLGALPLQRERLLMLIIN
jgi:hypothetical protein